MASSGASGSTSKTVSEGKAMRKTCVARIGRINPSEGLVFLGYDVSYRGVVRIFKAILNVYVYV